jgi:hypothetical protein
MPDKEKKDYASMEIREFLRKQGAKGGKSRAKKVSTKRLSEIGRLGAAASAKVRSAKAKAKAKTKGE